MSRPTVFITSATGTQGYAVAKQVCQLGWGAHATTRNIDTPTAKALQDIGVQLTKGDWDNEAALKASISGCTLLFLNTLPNLAVANLEQTQCKLILSLAKAAGVSHVVYASTFGANNPERITDWDPNNIVGQVMLSKHAIEEAVHSAGSQAWTILRPGFFMANFLEPKVRMYGGLNKTGVWTTALTPETDLPLVDQEDIARFVMAAFQDPGKFNGAEIELASELKKPEECMTILTGCDRAGYTGKNFERRGDCGAEVLEPDSLGAVGYEECSEVCGYSQNQELGRSDGNLRGILEEVEEGR
jgi:uncharacterized protein YbjT (DUF2867 family)